MSELFQLFLNGLVTGSILAIAAVGISLVYGVLKLVNFAGGDFLTYGAYVAFFFNITLELPLYAAVPLAMISVAILGVVLDLLLWSRLRKNNAGQLSFFLVAIGVALILRQLLLLVAGNRRRKFNIDQVKTYQILGARIAQAQLMVLVMAVIAIIAMGIFLAKTSIGKEMRAYSDNPSLASVSGINVRRVILATWIINGLLAGLAGVFQGMVQGSFESDMGWTLLLPIFAAVVLGTIGDAYGALLGGLLLGLVMELSTWSALFGGVPGAYKPVVAFLVLSIVLLVRPQGLLGFRARNI